MKLFACQACAQLVYFENRKCEHCGRRLGFLADSALMTALDPIRGQADTFRALAAPKTSWRFCSNAQYDACNWLVPVESNETLCTACRHNRMIPDLSIADNLNRWRLFEFAKHRLFYSLLRLKLPMPSRADDAERGLVFDFLDESEGGPRVITGHENGLITINLKEADDAEREKMRVAMSEPYRTLLGHFRHETGHYYWERLIADRDRVADFRSVFGDESADYGEALKRNYDQGPPSDWKERFISTYASCHPWEDFAETWAHYLHIVDTVETAFAFGLNLHPRADKTGELSAQVDFDPYTNIGIDRLIEFWLPLTFAMNEMNRSMGEPDLYPFFLSPNVIAKLGFIHQLVHCGLQSDDRASAA